jgi:nudix-type nucleoside diphosphatase (YffH/AdpP family)
MTKDISDLVRLHGLNILSDRHFVLRRADYDFHRRDGSWQRQARESYDIGHGAGVLLRDRKAGTVLLVRQFRWPVFESGHPHLLIEVIAGKLDGERPEICIAREALEEAGAAIENPRLVTHCFMSPGAVTERLFLFVAEYDSKAPRLKANGIKHEGEDIETIEITLQEAMAMVRAGEIVDAKTILLLQWVALNP